MTSQDDWPGLAEGITSRLIPVRDLNMHILEAGDPTAPLLLLLHGFPELAYSWRAVLAPLARLGYHVVAPDQRGYGRTLPRALQDPAAPVLVQYDDDLTPYRLLNLAHDAIALAYALGHTAAAGVVGHDFGSVVAGVVALARPDLVRTAVFMSAPFPGAPALPLASAAPSPSPAAALVAALARIDREHYTHYFASPRANADMHGTADHAGDDPRPLPLTLEAAAALPPYYVMPRGVGMPAVVAPATAGEVASARWLDEAALGVYVREFGRTGFQGGLNWYRTMGAEVGGEDWGLRMFGGTRVEMPAMFVAGRRDWGTYQSPGALERMRREVCARMEEDDVVLVDGAGHWVQQERPEEVVGQIERFLKKYEQ
ncbi:alpha/beta-hydrolase [Epithele typhae]|uniref:alpha/beta-hydrolase n=1 Tax=Epithele typhae TaxID=378194 RepID=UPI00200892C4|nr:alpha/beta-hydrolase [Epithele typhae]KAH9925650.1 alpha/beta-hydrolase [Epithele typhae]